MNLRHFPSLPHWLIPFPRVRIGLTYLWRHGRLPDLRNPRRFSELVQRRKLDDRDLLLPALADKIAVKAFASEKLGANWIIPTLWSGKKLPAAPHWPFPFILKASHGCNQNAVCHDLSDWQVARRRAQKWVRAPYGLWLDEWAYRDIPRGFIVEPYLGEAGKLPIDYKVYVFGGRAVFIQVHLDRNANHRWILYDRDWRQVSMLSEPANEPPRHLDRILASAEAIASSFDFARVDFYEIAGTPKFGEVTFYPGSGLDPFNPPELDIELGERWLSAMDSAPKILWQAPRSKAA